ncbi:RES domain-containing protein [Gemmatimonas sp.]
MTRSVGKSLALATRSNRMSTAGISMSYVATDEATAVAETFDAITLLRWR